MEQIATTSDGRVVKLAEDTTDYRGILLRYWDDCTLLYEALDTKIRKNEYDGLLLDATISKMIVIMVHLLPKLEGGGMGYKQLYEEFQEFLPWMDNVQLPKTDINEANKISKFFRLIARAYHMLNISNY